MEKSLKRDSSIELLKIIAIFCIILSHTEQTLDAVMGGLPDATWNIQVLILKVLRTGGVFGNLTFWVISSWFLLERDKTDFHKIIHIIIEIWMISMITLAITYPFFSISLELSYFFPISFQNNWYLTCYLMVYAIHGWLNRIIEGMTKKTLFRCVLFMIIIYYGVCYFFDDLYYSNDFIQFIVIYFIVAHVKRNMNEEFNSKIFDCKMAIIGLAGDFVIFFTKNFLAMKLGYNNYFVDKLQFSGYHNVFTLLLVLGIFGLFRTICFSSKVINCIASFSMYVYLIHENIVIRKYVRPLIWKNVLDCLGENIIVVEVIVLSVAIFACSLVIGIVYRLVFGKVVNTMERLTFCAINRSIKWMEKYFLLEKDKNVR